MSDILQEAEKDAIQNTSCFELRLDAFSGPLDLLCHLVENRELNPAKVNLTELITQYIAFLAKCKETSLNELADFFSFASRIILRKVRALLPDSSESIESEELFFEDDIEADEEELMRILENFRPYRNASVWLLKSQAERERYFVRIPDEEVSPFYDLGDLYGLSAKWWELIDRYNERKRTYRYEDDSPWDDIPDGAAEEHQVERRMEELTAEITRGRIALSGLLTENNKKILVVTLLALLEMSRLGIIRLTQNETLGDVWIVSV